MRDDLHGVSERHYFVNHRPSPRALDVIRYVVVQQGVDSTWEEKQRLAVEVYCGDRGLLRQGMVLREAERKRLAHDRIYRQMFAPYRDDSECGVETAALYAIDELQGCAAFKFGT